MPEEPAEPSPVPVKPPKRKPRPPKPPRELEEPPPAAAPRKKSKTESETLPVETAEEHTNRVTSERKDEELRRHKDVVTFYAFIAMVTLTFLGTFAVVFIPGVSTDRVKWAESVFLAIISGVVSYFAGKARGEAKG